MPHRTSLGRVRPDVDPPAGETRRKTRVLTLLADRERQLVVGHGHPRDPGFGIDDFHPCDARGRQRVRDEFGRVFRIVDDVDLFAVQPGHDVAHPAAQRADAGALGVDAWPVRPHGDLGPVTGLARDRRDLHGAFGDLRHLQCEQFLHQIGMST